MYCVVLLLLQFFKIHFTFHQVSGALVMVLLTIRVLLLFLCFLLLLLFFLMFLLFWVQHHFIIIAADKTKIRDLHKSYACLIKIF